MKLTNLSLAILVALGVAACGGSDNDNQTVDHNNGNNNGGNSGSTGTTTTTPPSSGLIPIRKAPTMTVPDDLKLMVDNAKRVFLNRVYSDDALGYPDKKPTVYKDNVGTNPPNVKYESTYNYKDINDVLTQTTGSYGNSAYGAIFVGPNPDSESLNAFAKAKDGKYYRVKATTNAGSYNPNTTFIPANATLQGKVSDSTGANPFINGNNITIGAINTQQVPQSEVIFIANANTTSYDDGIKLGDVSNSAYNTVLGTPQEVVLRTVKFGNQSVSAETVDDSLKFAKLPKNNKKIQEIAVTGGYDVINTKGSPTANDDKIIRRNAKLGFIKVYNLPYSAAYATTNLAKDTKKDIFGQGSLGIVGLQTIALPKEGRAFYNGKSFNADISGDIRLTADFAADRTGIEGLVYNRKDHAGNKLVNLTLNTAEVTSPTTHSVSFVGKVEGNDMYAKYWNGTFYGLEAEEVAGGLYSTGVVNASSGKITVDDSNRVEVYGAQRGELTKKSNTPANTP